MKPLNYLITVLIPMSALIISGCSEDEPLKKDIQYGSMSDYDGNTYKTVIIGNQTWMAENLKVTHFPDGTKIPLITENTDWGNLEDHDTVAAYCYYNNDDNDEAETYGALYTHPAATKACPTGWHLPSDEEWQTLYDYVSNDGHEFTVGNALKADSDLWEKYGQNPTDDYGFSALPAGYRSYSSDGAFYEMGKSCNYWSTSSVNDIHANAFNMDYSLASFRKDYSNKSSGYSIRCIKD